MRKISAMGSSRFEFNQQEFNRRHEIREDIYASAYSEVLAAIERSLSKADGNVVTRSSLEDWIGRKLVEEFIRRRG